MNRIFAFAYGTICYVIFLATFLYAIAFVGNLPLAGTIDGTPAVPFGLALAINLGWLLAFWATPTMTAAHLVFALATTAYILVAIRFEERDLATVHGEVYTAYRRRVPMLVPRLGRTAAKEDTVRPVPSTAG